MTMFFGGAESKPKDCGVDFKFGTSRLHITNLGRLLVNFVNSIGFVEVGIGNIMYDVSVAVTDGYDLQGHCIEIAYRLLHQLRELRTTLLHALEDYDECY